MLRSWFTSLTLAGAILGAFSTGDRIDDRVENIINNMEIDDILGQMTQLNIDMIMTPDRKVNTTKVREFAKLKVGSYLNSPFSGGDMNGTYAWSAEEWQEIITQIQEISMEENGGHPILYGIDSIHGANYVRDSVLFGQQINGAASFNTDLVYEQGRITGRDTEAAGIPWIFGPVLDVSFSQLWARTYETFGEDPYLASVMGEVYVKGMQSNNQTAACMKHFIGYSKTTTGQDRRDAELSDYDLLNYFAPPFLSSIKAGAMTAMENYISINGVPVVASTKILKDLVRNDMGFQGMIVTDWSEIFNLHGWHRVAKSKAEAVRMALQRTSLDMSMVPSETTFIDYAQSVLEEYPETLQRMKKSVRRIIKTKVKLGLYDTPVPGKHLIEQVGQESDYDSALELARESIILLKNRDDTLPLNLDYPEPVFLTGFNADNIGNMCGGWTLRWQGQTGNKMYPKGISIKTGLEKVLRQSNSINYFNGVAGNGTYTAADLEYAKQQASKSKYTIVAIGEEPYTEKPGDINDLSLPQGQVEYVKALASTGTKIILVLVQGRPRMLDELAELADSIIYAMLPGEVGGQAIAEIIYGKVNPSGKLPLTYPKFSANVAIPYYHRVTTRCGDNPCQQEFNFGHGLSYTSFEYGRVKLSKQVISNKEESIVASVTVKNNGTMAGKEVVMLFLTQPYRSISVPEVKQLKKFKKIHLEPEEATTVRFTLSFDDWSVFDPQIGNGFHRIAEDGDFVVGIKADTDCDVYNNITSPLCAKFELKTGFLAY